MFVKLSERFPVKINQFSGTPGGLLNGVLVDGGVLGEVGNTKTGSAVKSVEPIFIIELHR
ncbi:hypothetical protein SBF1_4740002 [Candidatus Desulfosporosinus infrequens]|uniref:Uncharacterized protein n=1 Tax=Candidatus Desulfosporosinus infrequens TaxID=2043169 RepID=A0A2U3LF41_9FIRM|nr:hypothetical protein SBF1_4740002 [Candidatus Desulfosporosinus infrequens]